MKVNPDFGIFAFFNFQLLLKPKNEVFRLQKWTRFFYAWLLLSILSVPFLDPQNRTFWVADQLFSENALFGILGFYYYFFFLLLNFLLSNKKHATFYAFYLSTFYFQFWIFSFCILTLTIKSPDFWDIPSFHNFYFYFQITFLLSTFYFQKGFWGFVKYLLSGRFCVLEKFFTKPQNPFFYASFFSFFLLSNFLGL